MNIKRFVGGLSFCGLALAVAGSPAFSQPNKPVAGNSNSAKTDAIVEAISDTLTVMADRHWHKGEYNHLINLTKMTTTLHPDNDIAYCDMGWLLWSMNRDDEAIQMYELGIAENPRSWYLYDEVGQYYMTRKKDFPKAILYYEKAMALDGSKVNTVHMLAHAYERTKQLDKALALWKKAASNPEDGAARPNLARVERLVASGQSTK